MSTTLSYRDAGVDTHEAARLVDDIAAHVGRTAGGRFKLFQAFGLFAAGLDLSGYRHPVIFTGTDGVGTKLKLLLEHGLPEVAGRDLVGMNVNDVLTANADPALFLDYVAMAKLDRPLIARLIEGMADALAECGAVLAGGETAEMPGLVHPGQVELAGFAIGVAEREDILDPTTVRPGDAVIGFPSNGFHANGWSLIRRILAQFEDDFTPGDIQSLLTPTRLYHEVVAELRAWKPQLRAMAHITGGGIPENLTRVLNGCGADLTVPRWEIPAARKVLAHVDWEDACEAFNLGIGWIAVVDPEAAPEILQALQDAVQLGVTTAEGPVAVREAS